MSKVSKKRKCDATPPVENSDPKVTQPLDPKINVKTAKQFLRSASRYEAIFNSMKSQERDSVAVMCNSLYKRANLEELLENVEEFCPNVFKVVKKVNHFVQEESRKDTFLDLMHFYRVTSQLQKEWYQYCFQLIAEKDCDCRDTALAHKKQRIKHGESFLRELDACPETQKMLNIINAESK